MRGFIELGIVGGTEAGCVTDDAHYAKDLQAIVEEDAGVNDHGFILSVRLYRHSADRGAWSTTMTTGQRWRTRSA